jgi:hypothetical protein
MTVSAAAISAPAIAVDDGGAVHIAWVQGMTSEARIMHRVLANGTAWSAPADVSEGYEYNGFPRFLTGPDGHTSIFWAATSPEAALYVRRWENGAWAPTEIAVDPVGITATYAPGISPEGDPIAAYGVPPDVVGFDGVELTEDGVTAGSVAFAVDRAGGYHVAWFQFANQTDEPEGIVYRYSRNAGVTWGEPELLSEGTWSAHELVADAHGQVHWLAMDGTYRRWTPSGGWEPPIDTRTGLSLVEARLAVDTDGLAHVVFATNEGLFIADQDADGAWSEPTSVAGAGDAVAQVAVMAIDESGRSHIAWVTHDPTPTLHYATAGP